MNSTHYYINEFFEEKDQYKFQAIVEQYFAHKHFTAITLANHTLLKKLIYFARLLSTIQPNDVVYFLYPLHSKALWQLLKLLQLKKIKTVCIVTDIDSFRDEKNIDNEMQRLQKFKYFIFQNRAMQEYVSQKIGNVSCSIVELFDIHYFPKVVERKKTYEIVFTGNTEKAPFISLLSQLPALQFTIYSTKPILPQPTIKAIVLQDDINFQEPLLGSFGLVWDGISIDTLAGSFGEYLHIATPLKFTKYMLAHLPVIANTQSAIAPFVLQHNIGILVNSLAEVETKINQLSAIEYQQMITNMKPIARKIHEGFYLKKALDEIAEKL